MNEAEEKVTITKKEFWELSNRYTQKELDERIAFVKKRVVKEYMKKVEELMQNSDLTKAHLKERAKKLSFLFADNITKEELHYIIRNALEQVEKTLFDECKEVLKEKKEYE